MQQMLACIVAGLVDVGRCVHTAPQSYDQPVSPCVRQRTVGLAAVDRLSPTEESAMRSDQGTQTRPHVSNCGGEGRSDGTTFGKSVDKLLPMDGNRHDVTSHRFQSRSTRCSLCEVAAK